MKILIVKLSALGDVVQSLPVAMAIRQQLPQAQIDWVVERPSAGLLAGHPALNRVLVSPRHEILEGKSKALPMVGRFVRQLRSVRYDAVLDLQGLIKSATVVALSRGGSKIGFKGGKERLASLALNQAQPPFDPNRHALERYLDLLEPLGLERPAKVEFGLEPSDQDMAQIDRILAEAGHKGGGPLIVLHPVAKWESKLWPVERWAELINILAAQGFSMALSGSPQDKACTSAIICLAGKCPEVVNLAGRTDLKQLAALMRSAQAVVATDTGAMHLAAAMGAPVAALFGPTAPWRTGPFGSGHRIQSLALDCSPCFNRRCSDPRCMEQITAEGVAEAVKEMLKQQSASAI
ncbi:MAG: lipopolysaccharide heptosyltransferase I [Desulfarculaceae bacterium]|jgi:lipopolysaccharide heptosyltransferase I